MYCNYACYNSQLHVQKKKCVYQLHGVLEIGVVVKCIDVVSQYFMAVGKLILCVCVCVCVCV